MQPYGRNWAFLWNVPIAKWQIALLVIAFFIVVWGVMMGILTYLSKTHTWLLPVFAVGLGAPRWCQMLWGTSSLALYIPWAGHAGPYLGVCLWLWLGVLDAIQGVGLGLILLQTLSRLHVCATLAFAQVIGSICVMVARATAPNRIGPGSVFPDAAQWDFEDGLLGSPLASAPFWIALICQIIIVIGYFWFYRKEQLGQSLSSSSCLQHKLTPCTSRSPTMITTYRDILHLHTAHIGQFPSHILHSHLIHTHTDSELDIGRIGQFVLARDHAVALHALSTTPVS